MLRAKYISPEKMCLWALAIAAVIMPARGGPVLIYGTGVTSLDPVTLTPDGAVDLHYSLIASADASAPGPSAYVAGPNNVYPISAGIWMLNGPDSKWIAPIVNAATNEPVGDYVYRTTFDLTGMNPDTARLTGRWATDNTGTVMLNGAPTGIVTGTFLSWAPFTISSGFVSGLNSLDFVVTNVPGVGGPSPTGLRVEISGSADSATVPEPTAGLLVGMTLFGMAGYVATRKRFRARKNGLN